MNSAVAVLRRRIGVLAPTFALAATATVGVLAAPSPSTAPAGAGTATVRYTTGSPVGKINQMYRVPGGYRARGWVVDPSAQTRSLRVVGAVDGHAARVVTAGKYRPIAKRKFPKAGTRHGFDMIVPVAEGRHSVCVTAIDLGKGSNTKLSCSTRKLTFDYGPYGSLETVDTRPGHVHVRGWTIDADAPTRPVTVRVTVDGVPHDVSANHYRSAIGRAHPGTGSSHGFELYVPVAQGRHTVCVTERNIGHGTDNRFACRTVTLDDRPVAAVAVSQRSGKLRVSGWAFDRDNTSTPLKVSVRLDSGATQTYTASSSRTDIAKKYGVPAGHGFDLRFAASETSHTACVTVANIGYGSTRSLGCSSITLNYRPTASLTSVTRSVEGLAVSGWAADPDTSAGIPVRIIVDGQTVTTPTASGSGGTHSGHNFAVSFAAKSGSHTICAVGVNRVSGTRDSVPSCNTATWSMSPMGHYDALVRSGDNVRVTGWAHDPDSSAPLTIAATVDGQAAPNFVASATRADVARAYPAAGANRGFSQVLTTTDGEHTVCLTAKDVGAGSDASLGCRLIIAVHPKVASAPRNVVVRSGYNAVGVTWAAPSSDGGAPASSYRLTASPGGRTVTVAGTATSATVTGLARKTTYRITVAAYNVVGRGASAVSGYVTTQAGPGPQTSPAPVSTSRYLRNIRTCSTAEAAELRAFGRSDAARNPAGHAYMMLLDIGGQNQRYGGVTLSATTRFVTYAALVTCTKAYVDGYGSAMHGGAPSTIAIGVNNDADVNATTGRDWATKVVNPLYSYARKYSGLTIAGANDIEPGFSGSYSATRSWLTGYLGGTSAKFVFNGSADGCAWTVTNRSCNNGWSMAGLYNLAAGLAPTRVINLPQVYNYTMADQWKYISLTGVAQKKARINFGGPLTEATACAQAHSCNSISGRSAWARMWSNLQSHPALRVGSLPYATDLRIDS